ncbi:hypothetical protein G6F42_027972 [Rhizopus arrhizus]|nr:hypothetical protein G6F42_027972 [Rhizopus arrhizus]
MAIRMQQNVAKRIGCTPAQLGIAWCLKNKNVTSVIIGASTPAQARENIQAIGVVRLLTDEIMLDLDRLLANKPEDVFDFRKS